MNLLELRAKIKEKLPAGLVVPEHTKEGHFYRVPHLGVKYGSVTGMQWFIKDQSLQNYDKNEALRSIEKNWKNFNDSNIKAFLEEAKQAPIVARDGAGGWGSQIHDFRQQYFDEWIKNNRKPGYRIEDLALGQAPSLQGSQPLEIISACAAIDKFIKDYDYYPIGCEMLLYSEILQRGGMGDDIGLMRVDGWWELVFLDLKSSNQYKDFYWQQVAAYILMFEKLTGIKIKRAAILKVDKFDRTYELEWLKELPWLKKFVKSTAKYSQDLEKLKSLRKRERVKI